MDKKKRVKVNKTTYSYSKTTVDRKDFTTRHCHDRYEILYVIDGKGKFIIEGREYPVNSHTVIVIPPLEYHCIDLVEGSSYERCVIHFTENDLIPECKECLSAFRRNNEEGTSFYISNVSALPIVSQIEQFEYIDSVPEERKSLFAKLLLSQLVLLLSSTSFDEVSYEDSELGARVIRYLNEHIDKDVSLDKLAKRFFVSKYYLCRAFKKHNGISVHGYINQKRVMYAKQLIESGETASGAAYRVGFGDYSAFYRAYIKIVGKSPTYTEEGK